MVEGSFPKVDGDILFATDVNKMSPKFVGQVTQFELTDHSGTSFVTLPGTVSYDASDPFGNYMMMTMNFYKSASDVTQGVRFRISGAGFDFSTGSVSSAMNARAYLGYDHVLTSGALTASGGNVGSPFDIIPEANSSTTNQGQIGTVTVTAF